MAFDTVYARNLVLDNPLVGGGTGPTGPTGPGIGSEGFIAFEDMNTITTMDITGFKSGSVENDVYTTLSRDEINLQYSTPSESTINTLTSSGTTLVNETNQMSILTKVYKTIQPSINSWTIVLKYI